MAALTALPVFFFFVILLCLVVALGELPCAQGVLKTCGTGQGGNITIADPGTVAFYTLGNDREGGNPCWANY
jgi:hypothetical protein